ncbi:MAG: transposase [Bacteroidia bacterium]
MPKPWPGWDVSNKLIRWKPAHIARKSPQANDPTSAKANSSAHMLQKPVTCSQKGSPSSEAVITSLKQMIILYPTKSRTLKKESGAISDGRQSNEKKIMTISDPSPTRTRSGNDYPGRNPGISSFRNAKQLVSYAGYDVVQRQSGSSLNDLEKISKKEMAISEGLCISPSAHCAQVYP